MISGNCPRCGKDLVRAVIPEGVFPRFRACTACSWPLDFDRLWARAETEPVTEVAYGFMNDPGLNIYSPEQGRKMLTGNLRYGVDPVVEFEKAVIFWVMNEYYIFNFGPAGACDGYWSQLWGFDRHDCENSDQNDPHDLTRFVEAQKDVYEQALAEVRSGRKQSHWMWYIFPQYSGLGTSSTSTHYAIKSVAEAEAYLRHPVLGPRLIECAELALAVEGRSALAIFGSPDDAKLRSCATLFAAVSPPGSAFERLLGKYFQGVRDDRTLRLMGVARAPE